MSDTVIKVENLSKQYRLGQIGSGTLTNDLRVWWAKKHGRPNPLLKIGAQEHGNGDGETVWALKDVSFEVQRGEVLGIIGRNGAGKSTLLKILSRVTAPTAGQVKVKGRIASLLEVGTGFHPELTGRENIYLNGAILGMSRGEIEGKFDEIVDFAEVEKYIDTPVKRYSSGMYVRLAFAVAAHLEPEILVVDEVLAVGDAEFQKKCLGKMGEVAKEGRTVLFVSHNMTAISNLCGRVLVIQNGKISFDGEKEDGISKYLRLTKQKAGITHVNVTERIARLPSDPIFQLLNFTVDQGGIQDGIFYSDKPITVRIYYRILKPVSGLRVGFDLKTLDGGIIIFRSFHDDTLVQYDKMNSGYYISESTIPAILLSDSSYEIDLLAGIHNVRWIIKDQIGFNIEMTNTNGINVQYADKRPGVLMPKISWDSRELSNNISITP
jgi:lipopolysaccharide transport system ATP-binding protein